MQKNTAYFSTATNELTIAYSDGTVERKTFKNRTLFKADLAAKKEMINKYLVGFLQLSNFIIKMR